MKSSGVNAVIPGWMRTCSMPSATNTGQRMSASCAAANSVASEVRGAARLAAKPRAKSPGDIAANISVRAGLQTRPLRLLAIAGGRELLPVPGRGHDRLRGPVRRRLHLAHAMDAARVDDLGRVGQGLVIHVVADDFDQHERVAVLDT